MIYFFLVFFVVGVGRETECVGATESTDIFYFSVEENINICMLSFLGKSKYYWLKTTTSLINKIYL